MTESSTGAGMASDSQSQADGDKCFTELTACWDAAEAVLPRMEEERKGCKEKDATKIKPSKELIQLYLQYAEARDIYWNVVHNLVGGVGDQEFKDDRRKKSADHKNRAGDLETILKKVSRSEGKL